jgi:hypothetical protein
MARWDVPLDRRGEDWGWWESDAFAPALDRDRGAEPRRQPRRSEPDQETADEGGSYGFTTSGWTWTWAARKSGSMENRSPVPTTGNLIPPAIIRSCCSTGQATVWRPGCDRSTCIVPRWNEAFLPEIERHQERGEEVMFRADAAFAQPEIYQAPEAQAVKHAIRLPANAGLERESS